MILKKLKNELPFLTPKVRASELAEQGKSPTAKPEDPSLIPGTGTVEGENSTYTTWHLFA